MSIQNNVISIVINYTSSGIKTLRGVSYVLMLVCIIASLLLIPSWNIDKGYYKNDIDWNMVALSAIIFFNGIFAFGIGLSIATIAESLLYQKQKQESADFMND